MKKETPENPFVNLVVNIVAPVFILNKGSHYLGPRWALLLALALPVAKGLDDYFRRGTKNYVALIGILNICLTGTLAVLSLRGSWFAVKDASLPLVLGLVTLGSAWSKTPAARLLFFNPQVLNVEVIEASLRGRHAELNRLLKRTTLWLSLSFFFSSACNLVLALRIFSDIDPTLSATAQDQVLNEQIARMTWMGFATIALPLMVFSGILVYLFLRRLSTLTGEPIEALLKK